MAPGPFASLSSAPVSRHDPQFRGRLAFVGSPVGQVGESAGLSHDRAFLLDALPPSSVFGEEGDFQVARIWYLKLGYARSLGEPAYSRHFHDCIARLGLRPGQWWAPLGDLPVIGNPGLATEATAPEAVLCEIAGDEVAEDDWRPGYYLLDMSPAQVADILGSPAPAFRARSSDAHSP